MVREILNALPFSRLFFMNYVQVEIETFDQIQREILVALLMEQGYEGFEEDAGSLKAFIPENDFNESLLRSTIKDLSYSTTVIQEKNWNAEWESNFQPVIIDKFCAIRATFHQPVANVQHEIVITPKMSFGTGHHPTTEMMVRMMKEIDFTGKRVLDFGTGTGLLAILAEKLGADIVVAIDNDEWSIENSVENFQSNGCNKIRIEKASSVPADEHFDVILANIIKSVILQNLSRMAKTLTKGGSVVLSGLLKEDKKEIEQAANANHLLFHRELHSGNWICLHLQNEMHITRKLN